MRKLSSLLLIALLAVVGIGCDSNDDESDADKFVGRWALVGVSDAEGDQSAAFAAGFSSVILDNKADGAFSLIVTLSAAAGGGTQTIPGTYTVAESNKRLTLTATTAIGPANLNFTYAFQDNGQVKLTTDNTTALLLNNLFGTSLVPPAVITVQRV